MIPGATGTGVIPDLTMVNSKEIATIGMVALAFLVTGLVVNFSIAKKIIKGEIRLAPMISRILLRPWSFGFAVLVLICFALSILHVRLVALKIISLFAVILAMECHGMSPESAFGARKDRIRGDISAGFWLYFACIPYVVLAVLAVAVTVLSFGYELETQPIVDMFLKSDLGAWQIAVFCFLGIILAPVIEEVIFRGVILPAFCRRFGFKTGLIMVSVVFAGMHFHLQSFFPLFVFSISLGLAYMGTGSLVAPIAMHILFNGFSTLAILLERFLS